MVQDVNLPIMLENRELATHEQAMEILNNFTASFQIVTISRIRGILSEELLRQALDIIQTRHPLLNSRIVAKSKSFWFETAAEKIPLSVVKKQQIQQWEEVVIQELNQKINSDRNLLRVTLINFEQAKNICYLITTIHHAIADASSCIQLHSEILTSCQNIAEGKAQIQVNQLPQQPSINKLFPKSIQGFTGEIGIILYVLKLKLQLIRYQPTTLKFEKNVPLKSRSCGLVHRKLVPELTTRLINACRQQKTTVQAALGAAMLFAVAKQTHISDKNNHYFSNYLSFRSSVNLRSRLQPQISNEHLGVMASAVMTFHKLKENHNFWDLARDIKIKLEQDLVNGDAFRQIMIVKKIMVSFLKNPHKSSVTAALTNIGRVNISQNYGQLELEEISFVPAQAAFGGIFSAAVSTFREQMVLHFMFSQPSMSTETVTILVDEMIALLTDNLQQV
ncbi:MAG: alcohol acetyltransferase [Rivularia sp. (in: cyanobacteria)]